MFMLFSGLTEGKIPAGNGKLIFYWHKSLGITLIALFICRIIARILTTAPAMPKSFSKPEIIAAKTGHLLLYIIAILAPISGYLMITARGGKVAWFNYQLPTLIENKALAKLVYKSHEILAWILLALIVGHVLAVVKHYIFKKENLLTRIG
jgi:cytochrome b561